MQVRAPKVDQNSQESRIHIYLEQIENPSIRFFKVDTGLSRHQSENMLDPLDMVFKDIHFLQLPMHTARFFHDLKTQKCMV
ncbi:hypothetical protein Fmac_025034 [Flemingia macrophylla]|uniref:Uncharacterized protein n=1 Tax=Flemingia macrophylla TaxID=520843 RepID=A0ABD1LR31_9FABA